MNASVAAQHVIAVNKLPTLMCTSSMLADVSVIIRRVEAWPPEQWCLYAAYSKSCQGSLNKRFVFLIVSASGVNASSRLGDEALKVVEPGEGAVPRLKKMCFFYLEVEYFGEFWGGKFKRCNNIGGYSNWRPTQPKYCWDVSPASSAGLTPVVSA